MDAMRRAAGVAEQGYIRAGHIPFFLLALGVVFSLYLWNGGHDRKSTSTQMEKVAQTELAPDEGAVEHSDIEVVALKTDNQLEVENALLKEQVVALKREASQARAEIQRSRHLIENRSALVDSIDQQRVENATLTEQLSAIPGLKSELSQARAVNQRAQHVNIARDNLVAQLAEEKELNAQSAVQLASLPGLKRELSFANAENARLQHVSAARDNLMQEKAIEQEKYAREIQIQRRTNLAVVRRSRVIPELKKELSYARAENQRASHVSDARDRLMSEVQIMKDQNADLLQAKSLLDRQKKELSFARAKNARLLHASAARDRLMIEMRALRDENAAATVMNSQHTSLKKALSSARAQNARLQHVSAARNTLMLELADVKDKNAALSELGAQAVRYKKELSYARAQNSRLQFVSDARDNLQLQLLNRKEKDAVEVDTDALATKEATAAVAAVSFQNKIDELDAELATAEDRIVAGEMKLLEQKVILESTVSALEESKQNAKKAELEFQAFRASVGTERAPEVSQGVLVDKADTPDASRPMLSATIKQESGANSFVSEERDVDKMPVDLTELNEGLLANVGEKVSLFGAERKTGETSNRKSGMSVSTNSSRLDVQGLKPEVLALRSAIEQRVASENLSNVSIASIENDQAVEIRLDSKNLYRAGDASITREGSRTLNRIGKILEDLPNWQIHVKGHTDSRPIAAELKKLYASNRELSSARASAVVSFLKLTSSIDSDALSAEGYGDAQPVTGNDTPQGRERNRRVEIVLRR